MESVEFSFKRLDKGVIIYVVISPFLSSKICWQIYSLFNTLWYCFLLQGSLELTMYKGAIIYVVISPFYLLNAFWTFGFISKICWHIYSLFSTLWYLFLLQGSLELILSTWIGFLLNQMCSKSLFYIIFEKIHEFYYKFKC